VFQESREDILEPALVVQANDQESGYVCQGNHRVAAAFAAGRAVRVRILRTKNDLLVHVREGLAGLFAVGLDYEEFVSQCRVRAQSYGYDKTGWAGYLSRVEVGAVDTG
jgi:hypothetical protein